MQNVEQTIISQFGTSLTLRQLIDSMNGYIDPTVDIDTFYSYIWDVDTAVGFGLDIWGIIVGVKRSLIVAANSYFGFTEGGGQPFGQDTFNSPYQTSVYTLLDDVYRQLILVKAMANISDCTVPSYNAMLQIMFAGRGRCYVDDLGGMLMQYTFDFGLQAYELAILQQSGVLSRPSGVKAQLSINGFISPLP